MVTMHANNKQLVQKLYETLLLCTKIFHSLVCQDLPAFVEDNIVKFLDIFQKHLTVSNPLLDTGDDDQVGVQEKLKTEICVIIDLFAKKYEEEFKQLPIFVTVIWELLAGTGLQVKNDLV